MFSFNLDQRGHYRHSVGIADAVCSEWNIAEYACTRPTLIEYLLCAELLCKYKDEWVMLPVPLDTEIHMGRQQRELTIARCEELCV